MRIGIDARMYGPNVGGGGLGRYVEQLVRRLPQVDQTNRYVLFGGAGGRGPASGFEKIETDIHWYTLKEQLLLGPFIDREHLDLVHFPHWNVPLNLKTPFIVTIHDLILLEQPRSARATTRHPLVYAIKHWAYKIVLRHAIEKSRRIIAVSEYTKSAILKWFPNTNSAKISVVLEGLTDLQTLPPSLPHSLTPSLPDSNPYLLTIGNSYPHKNLPRLIHAFEKLALVFPDLRLVLAGRRDVFFNRVDELITASTARDRIDHIADPGDSDLASLYKHAALFVFPSLCEGFGLPPLEAMKFRVPVVSSGATCLPEILGDAAVYFNPESVEDMANAIENLLNDPNKQNVLRKKGFEQIKRYDWNRMTMRIVDIYNNCAQ